MSHNLTWLISGGLGGLGLLFACWHAQHKTCISLIDIQGYHKLTFAAHKCCSKDSMITLSRGDTSSIEDASLAAKTIETATFGLVHAAGILQVCICPYDL